MTNPLDELFVQPHQKTEDVVPRDQWERPKIIPEGGGKAVGYTRASTIAKALDDGTKLAEWSDRMTAKGISVSEDLQMAFAAIPDVNADSDVKKYCRELVESAKDRAGANAKRTLGTALHAYIQQINEGKQIAHVPERLKETLRNYMRATVGVAWLKSEVFVVDDKRQVAGTADAIGQRKGQLPRIWDTKTGSIGSYKALSFMIQLAAYAHAQMYDPSTGRRTPYPQIDLDVAHILHVNPENGKVTLYDIDLKMGLEALDLAVQVRDIRKRAAKSGMVETVGGVPKTVMQRLSACTSVDDLRALYSETGASWGPREQAFADSLAKQFTS